MSKKTINLGAVVDDYTGDYLRKGGQKINDNFDEIYSKLGDGTILHAAGRWQSFVSDATVSPIISAFNPDFGSATAIDTALGACTVNLPAVSAADYGKVVAIKDVEGTWSTNNVTVLTPGSETINGLASIVLDQDYALIVLTYTITGWKYIPGIYLDRLASGSANAGVIREDFIAVSNQTVFTTAQSYNKYAVEVYRNGVLLYYKESAGTLDAASDYGSSDIGDNLVVLNGTNIKLRVGADVNDVISIVTYTQSVTGVPTSYVRYSVEVVDNSVEPDITAEAGQIIVRPALNDTLSNRTFSLEEFSGNALEEYNPNAFQLFLNGTLLTPAGMANLPASTASPAGDDEYRLEQDINGLWNQIVINSNVAGDPATNNDVLLRNRDILTIVYFNTEVGSTLPWDGQDSVKSRGDEVWLNSEVIISRTNKIAYTDTGDGFTPESSNVISAANDTNITIRTISQLFDSIWPIGTVYENGSNPANPGLYMGFGTWKPYAEGLVTFGFDENDANSPTKFGTANIGVAAGAQEITLTKNNIPELDLSKDVAVLYNNDTGEINISGCEPLPGASPTPATASISSETVIVNPDNTSPVSVEPISILPPHTVSYKWIRVA